MQRVMINGGPGSGKSTLARALGAATGLLKLIEDHPHLTVHHLRSRAAVRDFYARIGQNPRDH